MGTSKQALLSLWTWLEIALSATTAFLLQLLLLPTLLFDKQRWLIGRTFRSAGIVSAQLTPYWDFGVHGSAPKRLPRPMVVVSNHESNADPFLLSHLPWEMKYLAKAALFRLPIFGWAIRLAGDIRLERGEASSGRQAMERCAHWLDLGMSVMIFPEGTRSKTAELLPFKDGAFRLAIEKGVEVLPLAVSGTRRALPKNSWRFGHSRARVKMGEPVPTTGMTLDNLPELKERVRNAILAMRTELEPLTTSHLDDEAPDLR